MREELSLSEATPQVQWLSDYVLERFPTETRIGLVYPTSTTLVLLWLAILKAGKEPLILQYPTARISKEYWRNSIHHTCQTCQLDAILVAQPIGAFQLDEFVSTVIFDQPPGESPPRGDTISAGAVLQLSSGTTGFKKGIRYTVAQLKLHVDRYNQRMRMDGRDCIVSWLPLYHDMGFIACFVMPLFTGTRMAMIDPMTWVKQPRLLFDLIQQQRGTICYLPNFGFEVMAGSGARLTSSNMRHWISCSEPTYAQTIERFCSTVGIDPRTVSTCYGMAENIFAVSQSLGFKVFALDDNMVVSCGWPIPGTQVKVVDGELYVKSETSVTAYIGSEDIRDAEGFYPTGDMGEIIDGEVVISGRKRDILISAGRKYFLNDLDYALNRAVPDAAGRGACLTEFNEQLGTHTSIFLVERPQCWNHDGLEEAHRRLQEQTDLPALSLHFVPPAFITKTSSGKINRVKTLADWKLAQSWQSQTSPDDESRVSGPRLEQELHYYFSSLPKDQPLEQLLDSLGTVQLLIVLEQHGIPYHPSLSINDLLAKKREPATVAKTEALRILCLKDGNRLGFFSERFLTELSAAVGLPIHFEHVCMPPTPILLSDLIFYDWFMPRDLSAKYSSFIECLRKLKDASLILIDDCAEFSFLQDSIYPRLSHRFDKDPWAEHLGVRWARYTSQHHLLARELVLGRNLTGEICSQAQSDLEAYLQTPILKVALLQEYSAWTKDWDLAERRPRVDFERDWNMGASGAGMMEVLTRFIREHPMALRPIAQRVGPVSPGPDQPHFCSWLINPEAVDFVVQRYNSFCICGLPSSVPYLEQQLRQHKKQFIYSSTLLLPPGDYECVLQTGSWGTPATSKPLFDLMAASTDRHRPVNVPDEVVRACPPFMLDLAQFRSNR